MKYNIEFKCGHTEEVELFGKFKDREREIERLQECNCSACRKLSFQKQMAAEYDEVRMSYSEYKKSYSNCKTLHDSYDNATKTIVVFVKKDSSDDIKKDEAVDKETVAGVRMIDAEDLSWQLSEITKDRVVQYMHTHDNVTMVPLELILEIIESSH